MPKQPKKQRTAEAASSETCPPEQGRIDSQSFLPELAPLLKDGIPDDAAVSAIALNISVDDLVDYSCEDNDDSLHVYLLVFAEKLKVKSNFMDSLSAKKEKFSALLDSVCGNILNLSRGLNDLNSKWKLAVNLRFLVESFAHPQSRELALRYVSLPSWSFLSKERLNYELSTSPSLASKWATFLSFKSKLQRKDTTAVDVSDESSMRKRKRAAVNDPITVNRDEESMAAIFKSYFLLLSSSNFDSWSTKCIRSTLELFVNILAHPVTRKYFVALLDDSHVTVLTRMTIEKNPSLSSLLRWVSLVEWFSLAGDSSQQNEEKDMVLELQRVSFADFQDNLKDLMYASHGTLSDRDSLTKILLPLEGSDLIHIARRLNIWTSEDDSHHADNKELALRLIVDKVSARKSALTQFAKEHVYPTEATLFDDNLLPTSQTLDLQNPIPKLDLQFLNIVDYLHRSYQLYKLESAYEIREDIMDSLKKLQPKQALSGKVGYTGWSKMATPIVSTNVEKVWKAKIGEIYPAKVTISVTIDISSFSGETKVEWEELRESDVIFLLVINKPNIRADDFSANNLAQFLDDYGVRAIRGGEIMEMRDEADNLLNNNSSGFTEDSSAQRVGSKRKIKLSLDPRQYFEDIEAGNNCNESFNLLIRRNPRENNFKAVLETIRSLGIKRDIAHDIPAFIKDLLLGVSDPRSSTCNWDLINDEKSSKEVSLDFCDSFQDVAHIRESFPQADVIVSGANDQLSAPFTLSMTYTTLPPPTSSTETKTSNVDSASKKAGRGRKTANKDSQSAPVAIAVTAEKVAPHVSRVVVSASPRTTVTLGAVNNIRYTPKQIEAITSGMQEKMTMIVGPPGTGKTDVAVQIIANLYQQHPTQKILVVTHSNAALNDIFAKIMAKQEVDPRHLLRLGSGERDLRENIVARTAQQKAERLREQLVLENTFSKTGRVNWSLTRRLQLLTQVQYLASSLRIAGDFGSSCEVAEYFFTAQIKPRMQQVEKMISSSEGGVEALASTFPFRAFFYDVAEEQWRDISVINRCLKSLEAIFEELRDYRAYELLRTQTLRGDYLLTKQARIVAMTCKHAAIARHKLIEQGFHYDSLIVEEAAQILEIETLIPMVLQETSTLERCRLKRVVLLGDHHQLTPIVRHPYLRSYANLEQSMFARLVKLGFPYVALDQQGRCRPELASLFSWKYLSSAHPLGNLPNVLPEPRNGLYALANAGFKYTHQFVDVPDFQGKGEEAVGTSFQNLGEAEYVVAVYQYMRLLGYPATSISILTTYRAQRQLIRDLLNKRCGNVVFGMPAHVATVDRFQGQQNDFVLLSLVRTRQVGHVSDVRRLVVAVSRARLGLYIFGRRALFGASSSQAEEVSPVMRVFETQQSQGSEKLQLVAGESFPSARPSASSSLVDGGDNKAAVEVLEMDGVTTMGVLVYQMVQQAQQQQQQQQPQVMDTSS